MSAYPQGVIMEYSAIKTLKKGSQPLTLVIVVNALIQIARSQGIELDPNLVWSLAAGGYAVIVSLINWFKNRDIAKKDPAKKG
jgi:hypothetical protein